MFIDSRWQRNRHMSAAGLLLRCSQASYCYSLQESWNPFQHSTGEETYIWQKRPCMQSRKESCYISSEDKKKKSREVILTQFFYATFKIKGCTIEHAKIAIESLPLHFFLLKTSVQEQANVLIVWLLVDTTIAITSIYLADAMWSIQDLCPAFFSSTTTTSSFIILITLVTQNSKSTAP